MSSLLFGRHQDQQMSPLFMQVNPLGRAQLKKQREKDEERMKRPGFGKWKAKGMSKRQQREYQQRERAKKESAKDFGSLIGDRYKGG